MDVSLACGFLWDGVANPTPNPPPLSGLGTGCWLKEPRGGVGKSTVVDEFLYEVLKYDCYIGYSSFVYVML
jgi:hypothetical protein